MAGRITQAAVIAVTEPVPQPSRITQAAILSVQGPPVSAGQITQAAIIMVTANGKKIITLSNPISLACYNPCKSHGTTATIVYRGGN